MTAERPFEIPYIPTRLRKEFTGHLAESTLRIVNAAQRHSRSVSQVTWRAILWRLI